MNDKDYTKREHDLLFSEIRESLERIETQVLKTNGRVTLLEKFMWTALGTAGIITLIGLDKIVKALS